MLDASTLLAYLRDEPGAEVVSDGAAISMVKQRCSAALRTGESIRQKLGRLGVGTLRHCLNRANQTQREPFCAGRWRSDVVGERRVTWRRQPSSVRHSQRRPSWRIFFIASASASF